MSPIKKEIPASKVFTEKMIADAQKCKDKDEILEKVIKPNMAHIDGVTGQENDPRYWAYALQFVLSQLKLKEPFQ